MSLSREEIKRYARHIALPEVGMGGQEKLLASRVLVVGAGGLGSPALLYLAAAGVGTLGVADFDTVETSNLQRQVIHSEKNQGKLKTESAKERILSLNSSARVNCITEKMTAQNVSEFIRGYDVVIGATDNFDSRYQLNDECVKAGIPLIYGSILKAEGHCSVFKTPEGPCYRCLFPEPPPADLAPSCTVGGVIGVLPGIIGVLQAAEAVKLILGAGTPLIGRLLLYNVFEASFREVSIPRDPECPACGKKS